MNDQLKTFLENFLFCLIRYRLGDGGRGEYQGWAAFGRLRGRLAVASELRLITSVQEKLLSDLIASADDYQGRPFPDERNSGPCISWFELHKRNLALHSLEKPQAVPGNESVQLQPVAARRELRLLCLLVTNRDGQALSLPVHTLRPMPPRVCSTWPDPKRGPRRWSLDAFEVGASNNAGLSLRETHAKRPTAQVLERCGKHRQTGAFCAAARTFRTGGVNA